MINKNETKQMKELHIKRCTRCGTTDDIKRYTSFKNETLGTERIYYMCVPHIRATRKRYYYNGNKDRFIAANVRYTNKKMNERYEAAIKYLPKPHDWNEMSNGRKAKYIRDQENKIKKLSIN